MEKRSFSISDRDIKFCEFPNDLMMLAFLAGELPVSARFCFQLLHVSTGDYDDPKGPTWQGELTQVATVAL